MADVTLNLIDPLEARYSWGDKPDEWVERAKRDMVDAFKHHSVEELTATMRWIILHRRYSTMPTVGDVKSVIDSIVAERKAAERQSAHAQPGVVRSADEFMERLKREKDDAQAWARDWLRQTPLGREALADGWARALYNIVWQIKLAWTRDGKACDFGDIKLDDLATDSLRGDDLIKYFRRHCQASNVDLERKLVLREKVA